VVQGGVTDLIKLVTRQLLAGWPSHVAEWPPSPASNSLLPPPEERAREANLQVAAKWGRPAREFGQPDAPWAHWSVAFVHCLLSVRCIPRVTLILVEFQFSL
jgi:hypothetical protein